MDNGTTPGQVLTIDDKQGMHEGLELLRRGEVFQAIVVRGRQEAQLDELLRLSDSSPVILLPEGTAPDRELDAAVWDTQAAPLSECETRELVERYVACLTYLVTCPTADRKDMMTELAALLGQLDAGPRDVVDLHRLAVTEVSRGAGPAQVRRTLEEGRLCLLQLMGHLVSFYRSHRREAE